MSRSYSKDLRIRVVEAIPGGLSTPVTWYRRYRETAEVGARKQDQPGGLKLDALLGGIKFGILIFISDVRRPVLHL